MLDYSNAVVLGISKTALSRLQLIQNAAARFLTNTGCRQHITPILAEPHWFPVHYHVHLNILLFVLKALNTSQSGLLHMFWAGPSAPLIHIYNRFLNYALKRVVIELFQSVPQSYGLSSL